MLLGGHFDTVPAQGNRPGRRDAERVHGLGASDMKGALAVMIELVRDGAPFGALFFGREELPFTESALTPLLARDPLAPELVVMMEPTDNAIHAGCLGNINATWTLPRRRGPLRAAVVRRQRDPPRRRRDRRARRPRARAARLRRPALRRGRVGHEDRGRHREQRRPGPGGGARQLPLRARAARRRRPRRAWPSCAAATASCGSTATRRRARSRRGPLVDALIAAGDLAIEPKQAWTPVAEFGRAGHRRRSTSGPATRRRRTRATSRSRSTALVRGYRVLERFAAEALA